MFNLMQGLSTPMARLLSQGFDVPVCGKVQANNGEKEASKNKDELAKEVAPTDLSKAQDWSTFAWEIILLFVYVM